MRDDRLITLRGFLDAFVNQHRNRLDRPFCFVLGAGASQQSGIPGGASMAREWLEKLHRQENFENLSLEQWATAERLGIPDFEFKQLARFYPQLYSRCFREREEDGYAFLEKKMEGKDPSFGYSVLAYILSETPHKILVTTNFDNLVADALSIHSSTFPIVVGHDSLADYARVALRRPLIAKVHGSLGFAPKSDPTDLSGLSQQWHKALTRICERYTPIVVGYDGNDGSLMGCLEGLPDGVPDTVFWCFRDAENQPIAKLAEVPKRVRDFVTAKKGRLVPIPGFDELMLLMHRELSQTSQVPDLFERMKHRSSDRLKRFDEQQVALSEKLDGRKLTPSAPADSVVNPTKSVPKTAATKKIDQLLDDAIDNLTVQREEKPWWIWQREINKEADLAAKEKMYSAALQALPGSSPLLGNFALFLDQHDRNDEADSYYERAMAADPKNGVVVGNYAVFLEKRGRMADAEKSYRRAVELDPDNANWAGNLGIFLHRRKQLDEAEAHFRRALALAPTHTNNLNNFARLLEDRDQLSEAESLYLRALKEEPDDTGFLGNYAALLTRLGRLKEGKEKYERALELDPNQANNLANYAQLLFVLGQREEAVANTRLAAKFAPNDPALQVEIAFYRAAHLLKEWPATLDPLRQLIASGARSPGWNLSLTIDRAAKDGHPNVPLLKALAEVISQGADTKSLDSFAEWKALKVPTVAPRPKSKGPQKT